jgi:FdhD protein
MGRFDPDADILLRHQGMRRVSVRRVGQGEGASQAHDEWVADERALFLRVQDVGLYTLMWTPARRGAAPVGYTREDGVLANGDIPEELALGAGFLLTEGLIAARDGIRSMAICPSSPDVLHVELSDPASAHGRRSGGFIASSCGACGSADEVAGLSEGLPRVADTLRISTARLSAVLAALEERQALFRATGGTHAAALFDQEGGLLIAAEDLGRHNALDKAIGHCLLARQAMRGCGAMLSGRLSLEMVVKAARAGIELIAAVSAPSALAVEAAEQLGITLCGFVRCGRATIYSHGHRLLTQGA